MAKITKANEQQSKKFPDTMAIRELLVTITTSSIPNSGTDANVFFEIGGTRFQMDIAHHDDFERGDTESYSCNVHMTLGEIRSSQIRLWHDNRGKKPGWNVSKLNLQLRELRNRKYYVYKTWSPIGWLAKDEKPYTTEAILQEGLEIE